MTHLEPKPGFRWDCVRWDDANAPQRNDCSLCGYVIEEESVPLRMWNERGDACVFCDECSERWFGLQRMAKEDDDDHGQAGR